MDMEFDFESLSEEIDALPKVFENRTFSVVNVYDSYSSKEIEDRFVQSLCEEMIKKQEKSLRTKLLHTAKNDIKTVLSFVSKRL